jgi:hypothetical protein
MNFQRESVSVEAARVMAFITITSRGKLRLLELRMVPWLVLRLTQKCCPSQQMVLAIIKALSIITMAMIQ